MPELTFTWYDDDTGDEVAVTIPAKREKCDRCDGVGTHDHAAFSNGFTAEDFAEEGPEFVEDYMGGVYDVPCEVCHGEKIVLVPDREAADAADLAKYDEKCQQEAEARAERKQQERYGY